MENLDLYSTLNYAREKFNSHDHFMNEDPRVGQNNTTIEKKVSDFSINKDKQFDSHEELYRVSPYSPFSYGSPQIKPAVPEELLAESKDNTHHQQQTLDSVKREILNSEDEPTSSNGPFYKKTSFRNLDLSQELVDLQPYSPEFESLKETKGSTTKNVSNSLENKMLSIHKKIVEKSISQLDKINQKEFECITSDDIRVKYKELGKPKSQPLNEKVVSNTIKNNNFVKRRVYIVGEVEGARGFLTAHGLFCEIAFLIPEEWEIISPNQFDLRQQTMTSHSEENGFHLWNHPIDLYCQSENIEHWPLCVLNVCNLDDYGAVALISRGKFQFPRNSGFHKLVCKTWTCSRNTKQAMESYFINKWPTLSTVSMFSEPQAFHQTRREPSGEIIFNLDVIVNNSRVDC